MLFTNITEIYKNSDNQETRKESILRMAAGLQRFLLNYGHHHLSESTPQKKIVLDSLGKWTCQFFYSPLWPGSIFYSLIYLFVPRQILARKKKKN